MPPRTPILTLALAFSVAITARADERVDAALAPLAAPRAEADARIAQVTAKYVAELKELEPEVAETTGNLEAVLRLRKEIEEWKAGRPTPSFAAGDPLIAPVLRTRREAFDRQRVEAGAPYHAALRKLAPQIIAELDRLAKEAPRARERRAIHQAASDLREQLAAALAPGPPASAPGAAPGPAPLSLLGGELHAFGVDKDGKPVDLSAAKRFSDFVSVSVQATGDWAAVRANGDLVSNLPLLQQENVQNAALCDFITPNCILVLHRDGKVSAIGMAANDAPKSLRSVVDISMANDLAVAVRADGAVELWADTRGDTATDLAREIRRLSTQLVDVLAVDSLGLKTGVVFRDGTVRFRLPKTGLGDTVQGLDGIADIALGKSRFLALTRDGQLRHAGYEAPDKDLLPGELHGRKFTAIRASAFVFAARNPDGSWSSWGDFDRTGIPEKINTLGPVVDLAFDTVERKNVELGFVLWIH